MSNYVFKVEYFICIHRQARWSWIKCTTTSGFSLQVYDTAGRWFHWESWGVPVCKLTIMTEILIHAALQKQGCSRQWRGRNQISSVEGGGVSTYVQYVLQIQYEDAAMLFLMEHKQADSSWLIVTMMTLSYLMILIITLEAVTAQINPFYCLSKSVTRRLCPRHQVFVRHLEKQNGNSTAGHKLPSIGPLLRKKIARQVDIYR